MTTYSRLAAFTLLLFFNLAAMGQASIRTKVIDQTTKEPIEGATVRCQDESCSCGCTTDAAGSFQLSCKNCKEHVVSHAGYASQIVSADNPVSIVVLTQKQQLMQEIVVSANRGEGIRRSEAPIAIAALTAKTIQDTKPVTADQVINKVSGVNMVSLGNEQHQMSIRQPMTTKSLFLYLEDGIPVRTTGVFNHNALLEMNMAATKSIEVIKGPSSSLYGSEAIGGVVNFITLAPTATPVLKLSAQSSNLGYKRGDLHSSFSSGNWGFVLSGYYADKRNGFLEFSDFHKGIVTARIDYRFSDRTTLSNSATWLNYYSDMPSGVDSLMFATKTFVSPQTFTYRKVDAFRYRSTLRHNWSEAGKSTLSFVHRANTIGQNPAYRIKDDYRRVNGRWVGNKELAHGEVNASRFSSYALLAQHRQSFAWKKAVLLGGASVDLSPSGYEASYIRIQKDTVRRKYIGYTSTDSSLTNYTTRINNYAAFANLEISPVQKLRVVASLRYDLFQYRFNNKLTPSAFSGSPDTANRFTRVSPKIGATYNFSSRTGLYANYSEGFVPPQVTEMYTGVKVPFLAPSVFYNYEVGGWTKFLEGKVSVDASLYHLKGTNEIISVKLDDGSFANQNAGRTDHKGIELGLQATPVSDLSLRLSGAYSKHLFVDFVEKGISFNGKQMNNAPNWLYNAEAWYKPAFVKGLRIGVEWQHVGNYFTDPQNSATYEGYTVLNIRAGYNGSGWEVWANLMNATDRYFSYITTKSAFGQSYQLAEPRSIVAGLSIDLANFLKKD